MSLLDKLLLQKYGEIETFPGFGEFSKTPQKSSSSAEASSEVSSELMPHQMARRLRPTVRLTLLLRLGFRRVSLLVCYGVFLRFPIYFVFSTLCAVCDCGLLVPPRSHPSFVVVHACLEETWLLLLPNAGLCADKARSALPHSVRSGACVFVARNTSLLVAEASVTQKSCSSPRRTSIQSRTFHCLRQTLPFRGTLVRHDGNIPTVGGKCFPCAEVLSIPGSTGLVIHQQWFSSPCRFLVLCHYGACRRDSSHLQGTDQTCSTGTVISMFVCTVHAWIPGEHRRGIRAVECVTAHLRGFEEVSE